MRTPKPTIVYNPPIVRPGHLFNKCRWVENASRGLRLVSLSETGWYLDQESQDETVHAVVYQLPARHGKPQYVYGFADPFDDKAAMLDFAIVTDLALAKVWAEDYAERYADEENDYRTAWNHGAKAAELRSAIKRERAARKAVERELRTAKGERHTWLREWLTMSLAETRSMHDAIERLEDEWVGNDAYEDGKRNGG